MKINVNSLKDIPKHIGSGLCVYGPLSSEIQSWVEFHNLQTHKSGDFTNVVIPDDFDVENAFECSQPYEYVDGFSPNLNKHIHIGHVSNFVLAKALQKLGVGKSFIANLGDTLEGEVNKDEALNAYYELCKTFDYKVDKVFFASQFKCPEDMLTDGSGEYAGTKTFKLPEKEIVGVKSNGATSYFYQDVALASELKAKTLYMTGFEQKEHFQNLKAMFNNIEHMPLGLVTVNHEKMSSRVGNVIMLSDVLESFKQKFGDDKKLIWNVLAGYILKSVAGSVKNIDLNQLDNVKQSHGLYLSYTLAKLKSAGIKVKEIKDFHSPLLKLKMLKAKHNLSPNVLFEALVEQAGKISNLYEQYKISGHPENHQFFENLAEDLLFGMKKIGLFDIEKV